MHAWCQKVTGHSDLMWIHFIRFDFNFFLIVIMMIIVMVNGEIVKFNRKIKNKIEKLYQKFLLIFSLFKNLYYTFIPNYFAYGDLRLFHTVTVIWILFIWIHILIILIILFTSIFTFIYQFSLFLHGFSLNSGTRILETHHTEFCATLYYDTMIIWSRRLRSFKIFLEYLRSFKIFSEFKII